MKWFCVSQSGNLQQRSHLSLTIPYISHVIIPSLGSLGPNGLFPGERNSLSWLNKDWSIKAICCLIHCYLPDLRMPYSPLRKESRWGSKSRKDLFILLKASLVLPCWLSSKEFPSNTGNTGDSCSIPESGGSPGGGHGNLLQYSCLENPIDRGAWWVTVHRVSKT